MAGRRKLEIAGCVAIAVALHVAAAAMFLPEQIAMGANIPLPPAQVSAGSGEMSDLVEQWETPPETTSEIEQQQPEDIAEPEVQQPEPEMRPDTPPEAPAAPQLTAAKPNLPELPAPAPVDPVLPELRTFDPPVIKSELALDQSERPGRKPPKPTRPEPERRQQARQEPEPKREPAPQPQTRQRQAQQPSQQGGGAGGNAQSRSAGGGNGGISQQQKARLVSQWGAQIASCIQRRAGRVANAGRGGRVTLRLRVARNGVIQGVGVAASSGNPVADSAAVGAAQSAGRCPGAPSGLTAASYPFHLPIGIR